MADVLEPTLCDEWEQVWRWRYRNFLKLGFPQVDAELLADSHVDLHEAEALVEAGCSHELAELILF